MKTITFEELLEELSFQRQKRCIEGQDDMVLVITGDEGSGKSMLALALAQIDSNFSGKQIYYFWKDYLAANQNTMRYVANQLSKEDLEKYAKDYELKPEDLQQFTGEPVPPASCVLYDESATQMFNRGAMSKMNTQQVKMFIANRYIRLIHLLCVPKITSIDKYIREHRLRFYFIVHKEGAGDMQTFKYTAYVWSKYSYQRLRSTQGWWKYLENINDLIVACPPDFKINLPNLTENKYIKTEILNEYKARKALYNLKQSMNMEQEGSAEDDGGVKKLENKIKLKAEQQLFFRVQDGEDKWAWVARTGKSPNAYKNYL